MAASSDSPTAILEDSDHCLFVANLPQRMTNEELAISLYTIFKPFGLILSVKASRDQKGRPFGFVEYESQQSAMSALSYGSCLTLDSRRIRVELAKRQRKLCIKYRLSEISLEAALEDMRKSLQEYVDDEDFKLSLQSCDSECAIFGENGGNVQDVIAAVVKFEDPVRARRAFEAWRQTHPEWTLTWINMDRSAFGSNIRNSGLVQLVPSKDGSFLFPPIVYPVSTPRYSTASSSPPPISFFQFDGMHGAHLSGSTSPLPLLTSPRYSSNYEEEFYCERDVEEALQDTGKQLEQLSLSAPSETSEKLESWLGRTLFVGRLNGQSITLPQLCDRFARHGEITYTRLYNRGALGFDGVPLDAYAFLRFRDPDAVERAICEEHGRAWLGQAIKCEHARHSALSIMLSNGPASPIYSMPSFPVASYPLYYYPSTYYPNQPDPAKMPSNWFRAKAGTTRAAD